MAVESLRSEDPAEIGGYRLIGRLGVGGQGVVYLASRHDQHETQVALKVPHGAFGADSPIDPDHFTAEFVLVRRVARFCTARVLDAGVDEGRPYIVSEYIDGRSLQHVVEAEGPLRGSELERLAVGTITALAATHAAGVVHRDFKPHNVLLGSAGPRVVDFGVATALPPPAGGSSGRSGTPQYMAPEQVRDEGAGAAADVFSWAVTMTFAATGTPAFGDDAPPAVFSQILHVEPDLDDLPSWLRDVVARCLSKDAARRPQAHEILLGLLGYDQDALRRSAQPVQVTPQTFHDPRTPTFDRRPIPDPEPEPAPQRSERTSARTTIASWRRRRVLMVATALALAAALATGVGAALWPTKRPTAASTSIPPSAAPPQLTVGSANSITVTRQTAKTHGLRSIADLKDVSKEFVLGGAPEFETRHQGVIGLRAVYGVGFRDFQPCRLEDVGTLTGLLNGDSVQAAQLFTTDPAIQSSDLVVLSDPKHLFSAQNIVPLVYKPAVTDTLKATLNAVSAKLTTADLLYMNTRIAVNKDKFDAVARAWLTQVGLI